ncbi:hypothetical protein DOY81_001985 [Sarcophaga bullata]|nr:hypothetical protein DOY81_001985 [Sarcophaga bullata]
MLEQEDNDFHTAAVIVPQIPAMPQIRLSSNTPKNVEKKANVNIVPKNIPATNTSKIIKPLIIPTSSTTTTTTTATTTPSNVVPIIVKPPKGMATIPVRYNLRQILEETNGGQVIVNYYEKHKILREEHRTALISTIARYIDTHGSGLSISESNQLEAQIVEMFPTEKEEFYRTNKRGRIYNKVANMKRVYKKLNSFQSQAADGQTPEPSSPASTISFIKEEEDIEFYDEYSLNEWRSKEHTPEKYILFWKKTQKTRLKNIEDIEPLQQILELWPEYKQHNAVEFIHLDFCAKYPEATIFSEVFYNNKTKLEKMLYHKLSTCSAGYKYMQQYQKCNRESQNLIILWVLHQLFPPNHNVVIDEMGNKRKKRYSIQHSQNAYICIRSSLASLESTLKSQLGLASPPMILIVGELAGDIDQIFVYFEGVRFPMDSVVLAAQLVCELFFLFDLDYPEEAVLYYHFVQTFFLNIEPEMKNTKLYTVINEINAF